MEKLVAQANVLQFIIRFHWPLKVSYIQSEARDIFEALGYKLKSTYKAEMSCKDMACQLAE